MKALATLNMMLMFLFVCLSYEMMIARIAVMQMWVISGMIVMVTLNMMQMVLNMMLTGVPVTYKMVA